MRLAHSLALRIGALIAVVALGACAAARPEAADAAGRAAPTYYVMRHLQKAAGEDPGLSEEGRAMAERLAAWFGDRPPAAIYVSTTRRARDTAAPLAERLSVPPKDYDPRADPAELIDRVKAEAGPVLVVGHSNTVPELVARLGGERPAALTESDYGDIWVIDGGRTERRRLAP